MKKEPIFTDILSQEIINYTVSGKNVSICAKSLSNDLKILRGIFTVDTSLRRPKSKKIKDKEGYDKLLSHCQELLGAFQKRDWLELELMLHANNHEIRENSVQKIPANLSLLEKLLTKCVDSKEADLTNEYDEKADMILISELLKIYRKYFGNKTYKQPKGSNDGLRGGSKVRFIYKFFEAINHRKTDEAILKAIAKCNR